MVKRLAAVLALLTSTASLAGPVPVICIRDTADDPTEIRAFFDKIDRLDVSELRVGVFFQSDVRFVGIAEFVQEMNFHHGREDPVPLKVTSIRRLELPEKPAHNPSYVVGTFRSAWFDRGSDIHSSYTDMHDTWLVSFSGCDIQWVRKIPQLTYLLSEE